MVSNLIRILGWFSFYKNALFEKLIYFSFACIMVLLRLSVSSLAFQVISLGYMYDRYTGNLLSMCRKICF